MIAWLARTPGHVADVVQRLGDALQDVLEVSGALLDLDDGGEDLEFGPRGGVGVLGGQRRENVLVTRRWTRGPQPTAGPEDRRGAWARSRGGGATVRPNVLARASGAAAPRLGLRYVRSDIECSSVRC